MQASLYTGLSGLVSNQSYLDVIGDNLANSETIGFKESRIVFGDVLAKTVSGGAAPKSGWGGINPTQIGRGVGVKSIDPNMSQGVLVGTGRGFDLGIEGSGYFRLSTPGGADVFSRAGAFALDRNGQMVDSATGFRVQGQSGGIQVDLLRVLPPKATNVVDFQGTLKAKVGGPTSEILSAVAPWLDGTQGSVTGRSGPYDLDDGSGEPMTMTVRIDDGATRTVTFEFADFADPNVATVDEVVAVIAAAVTEAEVANEGGVPVIRSKISGKQSAIDIDDGRGSPANLLGLSTSPIRGEQEPANSNTELNDLVANAVDYQVGDTITVEGSDADGREVDSTFTYGTDGTTVGSLVSFLQALYSESTVSIDDQGLLELTANNTGDASLSLTLEDSSTSKGKTRFSDLPFEVSVEGQGPDRAETAIEIFDSLGRGHTLLLTFERSGGSVWDVTASLPDEGGQVVQGNIRGLTFGEDGSISGIEGGTSSIQLSFEGAGNQTVDLNFGEPGGFDGLTQFGDVTTASSFGQDGFSEGRLLSVSVRDGGEVQASYDNGQTEDLDTLSMAFFNNPGGLTREGSNLFSESANSGEALIGVAGEEGIGAIRAGTLESSNVDISKEFVRMIEAQRSYQANARIIQATDELLAEAVNLV